MNTFPDPLKHPVKARIYALKLNILRLPYFSWRLVQYIVAFFFSLVKCAIEFVRGIMPFGEVNRPSFGVPIEEDEERGEDEEIDEDYQDKKEKKELFTELTIVQFFFYEMRLRMHPYKSKKGKEFNNADTIKVPNEYLNLFYGKGDLLFDWEMGFILRFCLFFILYAIWGVGFTDGILPDKRSYIDNVTQSEFTVDFYSSCLNNSLITESPSAYFRMLITKDLMNKYTYTSELWDSKRRWKICNYIYHLGNVGSRPYVHKYSKCEIKGAINPELFEGFRQLSGKDFKKNKKKLISNYVNFIKETPFFYKLVSFQCYPNEDNNLLENKIKVRYDYRKKRFRVEDPPLFDSFIKKMSKIKTI